MLLSWWKASCIVAIDCQLQLAISGNCAKLSRNEILCKVRALDMQSRVPFAFCELETRFILLVSLAWKTSWHLSRNKTYQGKFKLHSALRTRQLRGEDVEWGVCGAVDAWHEWSPMPLGKANLTEPYRMRPGLADRKGELQLLALWQFGHLS